MSLPSGDEAAAVVDLRFSDSALLPVTDVEDEATLVASLIGDLLVSLPSALDSDFFAAFCDDVEKNDLFCPRVQTQSANKNNEQLFKKKKYISC